MFMLTPPSISSIFPTEQWKGNHITFYIWGWATVVFFGFQCRMLGCSSITWNDILGASTACENLTLCFHTLLTKNPMQLWLLFQGVENIRSCCLICVCLEKFRAYGPPKKWMVWNYDIVSVPHVALHEPIVDVSWTNSRRFMIVLWNGSVLSSERLVERTALQMLGVWAIWVQVTFKHSE